MKPVALITGGQQGIGFGIAKALAADGFAVALASQLAQDDPAVQQALSELGTNARYFPHELQDVAGVNQVFNEIEGDLGPISTLVSNAGVPARVRGDMLDILPEDFDFVLDVNLRGAFFLAQEAARRMLGRDIGHFRSIVFVTSASASLVSIERAEYCISKAGAAMMSQLFATRLAADGIGVYELRPGIIDTAMTAGVKDKYSARIENGLVPAGRWGQPADVGSAILPLVTGKMAFATGAVIPVDGGLAIPRL
jgi:NAD(P)-dependent dehydrogenase (short-subunit alcohol dehydrogenase family)